MPVAGTLNWYLTASKEREKGHKEVGRREGGGGGREEGGGREGGGRGGRRWEV